jgi:hypothetical protein
MPTHETAQFGSFDGLDNRKTLAKLFEYLGAGMPDAIARQMRADFLRSLLPNSVSGMAGVPMIINQAECSPVGAYKMFIAITGCLGVPVERAAKLLEFQVRETLR